MEAVAWPDPGDPGEAFRLPPGVPGPPLGLELTGEGGGGGATIEAPEAALRVGLGGLGGGPGGPGGNCGAMGRSGPVGGLKQREKKNHAIPNEEFGMPNLFHQSDRFFDQQTFFAPKNFFSVSIKSLLFLSGEERRNFYLSLRIFRPFLSFPI